MNRVVAALAAVLAAVVVALSGAATASAHAELESASPLDGSMLTDLPGAVELTFTEPIGKPADLVVLDPNGSPVATGDVGTVDRVLATTVDPAATPIEGYYTVSYQVTSADGHLITGTTTFMVHLTGNTVMPAGQPGAPLASSTRADPVVVGALAGGLAIALVVALGAARRVLLADPR